MSQHIMNPEAESKLRTVFKLSPDEELPEKVDQAYWVAKAACDRLSRQFGDSEIVAIALHLGAPPADEPRPVDSLRHKPMAVGSPIDVQWRDKWVRASFVKIKGRNVIVDMNGVERIISGDQVRLVGE